MLSIGFVVVPGFQMMSLAALSVFEMANFNAGEKLYSIRVLSEGGGPVASSIGTSMDTRRFSKPAFDTLLVSGILEPAASSSSGALRFIRRASTSCRRTASICTGAFILAEAGLLDERRATTHWQHARELQRRFPKVRVEDDRIFIIDGSIWTSAGMSAGIDLALGMVEKDFGAEDGPLGGSESGGLSPTGGWPVAAFSVVGDGREIRPHSERPGLCQAQSAFVTDRRSTRGRCALEPAPIQPCFPHGNRPVTCESR